MTSLHDLSQRVEMAVVSLATNVLPMLELRAVIRSRYADPRPRCRNVGDVLNTRMDELTQDHCCVEDKARLLRTQLWTTLRGGADVCDKVERGGADESMQRVCAQYMPSLH